jgi:hypothetical protein
MERGLNREIQDRRTSQRARLAAFDGPIDPYVLQTHYSTIPHSAGEEQRRVSRTPHELREVYAGALAEDQHRMARYMNVGPRSRVINLNHTDPNHPVTITAGTDWLKDVLEQQNKKWGKTRMTVDREVLRSLPGTW